MTGKEELHHLIDQLPEPEVDSAKVFLASLLARGGAIGRPPKGSPQAILEAAARPPHCTKDDVDALLQAIREGKRPAQVAGIFDTNRCRTP